jgi:DnaK suppressor protein
MHAHINAKHRNGGPSPEPIVLPPDTLDHLREVLLREKEAIYALYQEDVHAAREIQEEGTEDFEELATMDVDREMLLALSEAERTKLRLIEDALARMGDGTYGFCQRSGRPISAARLREVPWALYCTEHQTLLEDGLIRE